MNTASPENRRARNSFGFLATHVPFVPPAPGHFNPWLATLASQRIDYVVRGRVIWVPARLNLRAQAELAAYEEANEHWPRHPESRTATHSPLFSDVAICTFLLFEAALFRFHLFVQAFQHRCDEWQPLGIWELDAVLDRGEWWRCITALTLHADAHHVLSNMLWGFIFGSLAASQTGTGAALLLMVLSGALGNATMALCCGDAHQSLGASTMVFGLLGILTAIHTIRLVEHREDGRGLIRLIPWVPLAFGVAMAVLSGAAPGSDVLAHTLGFLWGLVLGALPKLCPNLVHSIRHQIFAGALALAALVLAWLAAFYHLAQFSA